ncbi:TadE/TadG family type IV pilus assembly protein [Streptomyces sp. NPDC046876]|uniref:TadE/TadG family type IV pilus assembly protein n=1 Tax=Streptomyces sp. NPDC046876 TaxID=3155616 RepID=UPI0033D7E946
MPHTPPVPGFPPGRGAPADPARVPGPTAAPGSPSAPGAAVGPAPCSLPEAERRGAGGRDRVQLVQGGADRRQRLAGLLRSAHRDRGQVALEYIGFIPILLFVALCAIQLGWVAYVHEQADTAARTAARAEARKRGSGEAAGRAAVRAGLDADVTVDPGRDAVTATVRIKIKSIVPGLGLDDATRTAIMPNDDPEVGP